MTQNTRDNTTFVDLIYEHQGIVHRICSIYESSPEDREDLYQEIILQSWRSFGSFNGQITSETDQIRVVRKTWLRWLVVAGVLDTIILVWLILRMMGVFG